MSHTSRSFEGGDSILEDGANTMSSVEVGDGLADRLAEHAEEWRLRGVDDDDVQAVWGNYDISDEVMEKLD